MVPPCSDRISRVPPYSRISTTVRIRGCHPLWPAFPDRSAYPRTTTGLFRFRSPLLAESLLMSFPPGTEMFQFPGFASPRLWIQMAIPQRGGLPHSDIHGSTPARGSPWLFAACHVLHRLLVPRHPPNALIALEINSATCTETILSSVNPTVVATRQRLRRMSRSSHSAHNRSPLNARTAAGRISQNLTGQTCNAPRPRDAPEPDSP